jgi:hypothetical protein
MLAKLAKSLKISYNKKSMLLEERDYNGKVR